MWRRVVVCVMAFLQLIKFFIFPDDDVDEDGLQNNGKNLDLTTSKPAVETVGRGGGGVRWVELSRYFRLRFLSV